VLVRKHRKQHHNLMPANPYKTAQTTGMLRATGESNMVDSKPSQTTSHFHQANTVFERRKTGWEPEKLRCSLTDS